MKGIIEGSCEKCGNNKFLLLKEVEGDTEEMILIQETLGHDGFGYDLNTFNITCSKCGSINEDVFNFKKGDLK